MDEYFFDESLPEEAVFLLDKLPEEDMDEAVVDKETTIAENIYLRIKDDADQTWLWNGEWLSLEGDDSKDGGYPAYSYFDVVRILQEGLFIE